MTDWLFDVPLVAGLLWLGWRTMVSPYLFRAILFFIVFGLFMALSWARLAAPDVALAEAAIGAGLTGALLLEAYRVLRTDSPQQEAASGPRSLTLSMTLALLGTLLVAGLGWALLSLPTPTWSPDAMARARITESGVDNPVTAVLLNFRAYDTLLEVTVLLLALLGVWAMGRTSISEESSKVSVHDSPLMETLVRLLVPVAVLTGGYLLWAGAHTAGGAFQAGAVLAAIGVLLSLSDRLPTTMIMPAYWLRILLALGLVTFSSVALAVLIGSRDLLEYPVDWAGPLILSIESTLTISIALTLVLLFRGPPGGPPG